MVSGIRPTWIVPLTVCCLLITLFLIAATIVLALIPVYLSPRNINANRNTQENLLVGYASDVTDGSSLTLANTNSLSTQLTNNAGLSANNVNLQSGSFASTTASNGKKRQISNGNPTCERATSLTGNIFTAQYQIKYPASCFWRSCRERYKTRVLNALRRNYQTDTDSMSFTNGETRNVRLVFCALLSSGSTSVVTNSTDCTTETKNNIYLLGVDNTLYEFNPVTLNVTIVGPLSCSVVAITLQRNGTIWASCENGQLYNYIITSKQFFPTNYVVNQSDTTYFTTAFVKNDKDNNETLYVGTENRATLGKIDLTTLTLSVVGNYSDPSQVQDLTGTNDGKLFSVLGTDNYTIAQIDKTNAKIIVQYPLGFSRPYFHNFAIAAYKSNIFFFSGNLANFTNLYLFNTLTNTTTMLKTYSEVFVGAGVSTCLGT